MRRWGNKGRWEKSFVPTSQGDLKRKQARNQAPGILRLHSCEEIIKPHNEQLSQPKQTDIPRSYCIRIKSKSSPAMEIYVTCLLAFGRGGRISLCNPGQSQTFYLPASASEVQGWKASGLLWAWLLSEFFCLGSSEF